MGSVSKADRRFGAMLGVVTAVLLAWSGAIAAAAEPSPAAAAASKATTAETVEMVVDFGDGVEVHFTRLPWKPAMTVADAVKLTDGQPHGPKFVRIGSGETLLVTQIGDLKNEGRGRDRRNWLYQLNGTLADEGAGAQSLKAGDRILWKFERYDYNSSGSK